MMFVRAVMLDRFCGSGITSVNIAAAWIMSGAEDLVIAGGTEMMSLNGRRADGPFMMDVGNLRLRAGSAIASGRVLGCRGDA